MTVKEIIAGLKFTVDMFLFDPGTGEVLKEPRNDMDKTSLDALKGAIALLEQIRWIPCSESMPEEHKKVLTCVADGYVDIKTFEDSNGGYWQNQRGYCSDIDDVIAWCDILDILKCF